MQGDAPLTARGRASYSVQTSRWQKDTSGSAGSKRSRSAGGGAESTSSGDAVRRSSLRTQRKPPISPHTGKRRVSIASSTADSFGAMDSDRGRGTGQGMRRSSTGSIGNNRMLTSDSCGDTPLEDSLRTHADKLKQSKERAMEFINFCIFLVFFVIVNTGRVTPNAEESLWKNTLLARYASNDDKFNGNVFQHSFRSISSIEQMWRFIDVNLMMALVPDPTAYSNSDNNGNFILGQVLIQQKRIATIDCPAYVSKVIGADAKVTRCFPQTFVTTKDPFMGTSGTIYTWSGPMQPDVNSWLVPPGFKYGSGGYYAFLDRDMQANGAIVRALRKDAWVNDQTRAVTIDFTIYNAQRNLICAVRLLFELPPFGGVQPSAEFRVASPFNYETTLDVIMTLVELFFVALIIRMGRSTIQRARERRLTHFLMSWGALDIINLIIFAIIIIGRVALDICGASLAKYTATEPFVNWSNFAYMQGNLRNISALNVILTWMRVLKYMMKMSPSMKMIKRVFLDAWLNMFAFLTVFTIVFMGFVQAFFLAFHVDMHAFGSVSNSFLTLFQSIIGPHYFKLDDLIKNNYVLGTLLFIFFIVLIDLLLAHMFLAIVHGSYHQKRVEAKDQKFAQNITMMIAPTPRRTNEMKESWRGNFELGVLTLMQMFWPSDPVALADEPERNKPSDKYVHR